MLRRYAPVLVLLLTACAVNPATGRRELSLIGEGREISMGREADQQVTASLGLVDDPELQGYVSDIGVRMAAVSERPGLPWSFKVVDDPVVNAFALPGGFIYVTRGILAHFESEAELAGVIGHEIGHVTARHSVSQMSQQILLTGAVGVGMVFSERVRDWGDVLGAGLQLATLKFSRDDESQSDELGLRYMARLDYDADALIGVFQMLGSVSGDADSRLPEWQLTHPYPENRESRIRQLIVEQNAPTDGVVAREEYLDRIDGMMYGPNPREGYFIAGRFVHPDLAFELTFPDGWQGVNQRTMVAAVAPAEDGIVMLELAQVTDPLQGLRAFLDQEGVTGGRVSSDESGGLERHRAPFQVSRQDGTLRGEALFVKLDGQVYSIVGFATSDAWGRYSRAVSRTLSSFERLTDEEILGVQPWRLEVVTVRAPLTLRAFHEAGSSPVPVETLARLNRVDPEATLTAGVRAKRVVGTPLPGR